MGPIFKKIVSTGVMGSGAGINTQGLIRSSANAHHAIPPPDFPVVAATNNGTDVANGFSTTVQLPSGITSGNLLLIFASSGGAIKDLAATGWTNLYNGGTTSRVNCLYRFSTGSEGSTLPVTWSASPQTNVKFFSMRITGWDGSTPPESGVIATANNANPNPPSLSPSWGAANTLWIVHMQALAAADTVTAYPANYIDNQYTAINGDTTTAHIAIATRNLNAASDDPGTFTITAATWTTNTVAVRP